jgi:ribonuclease HII
MLRVVPFPDTTVATRAFFGADMRVMGLDEAGRGCVLGPLVVGAYVVQTDRVGEVIETGATDSKKLSPKKRVRMRELLKPIGTPDVMEISEAAIDAGNINTLEEEAFGVLIMRHRPDHVIIDAPCHPSGIPNFIKRLLGRLNYVPKLTVEPKADLNYPACSAASIFAKVHRDSLIDDLRQLGEIGSGYPSDPKTRLWLKGFIEKGADFPPCVRTRWGTIDNLREEVGA